VSDSVINKEMNMTRGGAREGAGNQPVWKSGKTKVIRVPEALADRVLEYAHNLDENNDNLSLELVTQSKIEITPQKVVNLSGISIKTHNGKLVVNLEDLAKAGYEILPANLGMIFKDILHKRLGS
jgi:hypothetical protein